MLTKRGICGIVILKRSSAPKGDSIKRYHRWKKGFVFIAEKRSRRREGSALSVAHRLHPHRIPTYPILGRGTFPSPGRRLHRSSRKRFPGIRRNSLSLKRRASLYRGTGGLSSSEDSGFFTERYTWQAFFSSFSPHSYLSYGSSPLL